MVMTPEFIQWQILKNKPTQWKVSWVRPTNFIDKKQAFWAYEKAKKDNYSWDFVKFIWWLEKKWRAVEESSQIKTAKAEAEFIEKRRQTAQKQVLRKIPISEATWSEIWNDLMDEMWESAKTFLAPTAWALQWLADIWQWAVWKPVEFLAKKFMWMFGFDDESLESLSTQSDISKWLNPTGAMIGKEVWKLAWSIALTPWWAVWWSLKALKWVKYMQEVAKRIAIWAWEWLLWNLAYNVASSDSVWTPVNLWVWAWIWAWFRFLPVIWNWLSAIAQKIPWIKNARASKLELSWIMNRTKLEYLQDTLRQWGAEELAKGTPEDVAEWMFQRGLEWNKQTIMWKLDEIADASMDMLSKKLSKVEWVHDTGTLDDILKMLDTEYSDGISTVVKNKAKTIQSFMAKKAKEWWLTISEINEVKKMVYRDLNPYTATGKVKVSKEDIAFANREIKNFIEQVAERAWVTSDWMTIKLLNNEFAMADSMKKAIAQKDALDVVSTITNFISHSGSPLAIWGIAGANVWPFDKNTTEWMIWNIIVWAMIWKVASSTTVRTKVANWLRNMPEAEKAGIYKVLKKGKDIVEWDKQVLLNSIKNLDVDMIDNASVNFLDEADIARISNSSDDVVDWVSTIKATTEPLEQAVSTPTASLDDMLKNATDEELKAQWFTATMIKKIRKQTPVTANQSIAQQWDELLQTPSVVSKVDDALPTAWKMEEKYIPWQDISDFTYDRYKKAVLSEFSSANERDIKRMYQTLVDDGTIKSKTVTQTAKSLEPSDLTESIKKAKAEGKTFEEFVSNQEKEWKILYHWTDADIEEFSSEFIWRWWDAQRVEWAWLWKGIYLTNKQQEAEYYADLVANQNRDKNFRDKHSDYVKKIEEMFDKWQITKEQAKEMYTKWWPMRSEFERNKNIVKSLVNWKIATAKDIEGIFWSKLPKKYIDDWFGKKIQIIDQEKINSFLKDKWFIWREEIYTMAGQNLWWKEKAKNIVIFNPKNIKTTSQLRTERDKLDVPTTSAISKDIPKELIEEAKKYKSADDFIDWVSENLAKKDIMTFDEFKKTKPNTTKEMYNKIKKEMPFMLEKDWEFIKWVNQSQLDKMVDPWNKWWHYQLRQIREQAQK